MDFCVLIPHYNDPQGLIDSIESIRYDVSHYAILIVDDGSSPPLDKNVFTLQFPLYNIEIINLQANVGITGALNTGLDWIAQRCFRYIARLDCGDICNHNRFYDMVSFLDNNPHINLLGSWCLFKNYETKSSYIYKTPINNDAIKRGMYFRNLFIHPTVMWRNVVQQKYPETFPHAEDYAFFFLLMQTCESSILPQVLVTCKINPSGLSVLYRRRQLESRIRVVEHYGEHKILKLLGIIKVRLLMVFPYSFILQLKEILYPSPAAGI